MPKTISFHNGAAWSRGHNIRDERYTDKQKHIDKTLTEQNVTVRDEPVRQAYAEIFGQAVDEYNAKQKRSDRRITDYYDKIKQDKRKHPVYECIVQIGDRSDTGNTAEQEKQALIRFAEEWDKRNPNLHLVGAYIHCDEPDGTVHM
ncbi:MAG: plasmid recombination protein, partial [Ruminococcus sp.]|nr:plasmid recombination protein [Ruminococcus sp.]